MPHREKREDIPFCTFFRRRTYRGSRGGIGWRGNRTFFPLRNEEERERLEAITGISSLLSIKKSDSFSHLGSLSKILGPLVVLFINLRWAIFALPGELFLFVEIARLGKFYTHQTLIGRWCWWPISGIEKSRDVVRRRRLPQGASCSTRCPSPARVSQDKGLVGFPFEAQFLYGGVIPH